MTITLNPAATDKSEIKGQIIQFDASTSGDHDGAPVLAAQNMQNGQNLVPDTFDIGPQATHCPVDKLGPIKNYRMGTSRYEKVKLADWKNLPSLPPILQRDYQTFLPPTEITNDYIVNLAGRLHEGRGEHRLFLQVHDRQSAKQKNENHKRVATKVGDFEYELGGPYSNLSMDIVSDSFGAIRFSQGNKRKLWVVNFETGEIVQTMEVKIGFLKDDYTHFSVVPASDNKVVIVAHFGPGIWRLDLETNEMQDLLDNVALPSEANYIGNVRPLSNGTFATTVLRPRGQHELGTSGHLMVLNEDGSLKEFFEQPIDEISYSSMVEYFEPDRLLITKGLKSHNDTHYDLFDVNTGEVTKVDRQDIVDDPRRIQHNGDFYSQLDPILFYKDRVIGFDDTWGHLWITRPGDPKLWLDLKVSNLSIPMMLNNNPRVDELKFECFDWGFVVYSHTSSPFQGDLRAHGFTWQGEKLWSKEYTGARRLENTGSGLLLHRDFSRENSYNNGTAELISPLSGEIRWSHSGGNGDSYRLTSDGEFWHSPQTWNWRQEMRYFEQDGSTDWRAEKA